MIRKSSPDSWTVNTPSLKNDRRSITSTALARFPASSTEYIQGNGPGAPPRSRMKTNPTRHSLKRTTDLFLPPYLGFSVSTVNRDVWTAIKVSCAATTSSLTRTRDLPLKLPLSTAQPPWSPNYRGTNAAGVLALRLPSRRGPPLVNLGESTLGNRAGQAPRANLYGVLGASPIGCVSLCWMIRHGKDSPWPQQHSPISALCHHMRPVSAKEVSVQRYVFVSVGVVHDDTQVRRRRAPSSPSSGDW